MAKIGPWVKNRKGGESCKLKFDNGQRIVIKHDKGGFKTGWLTIDRLTFFHVHSERVFACNLDSEEGKSALGYLTRDVEPKSLDATPLGAFVKYLKSSTSVEEVKGRCRSLMAIYRPGR